LVVTHDMRGENQSDLVKIRTPHTDEIAEMIELFADEVANGLMLPRNPDEMRQNIHNWLVAEYQDEVVGCVSIVPYDDELCEVRSLAVAKSMRGKGLGSKLVDAAVDLAGQRDLLRVLTLTRAVDFFLNLGFARDIIANYPEKVWKDCAPCPLKHMCDEVALIYHLDGSHNNKKDVIWLDQS